jgi:hypothetical protein
MDAVKIYKMMKPHLENLDVSEKKKLSRLINGKRPKRVSCQHRTILSLSKAKEKLKKVCQREMERQKQEGQQNFI